MWTNIGSFSAYQYAGFEGYAELEGPYLPVKRTLEVGNSFRVMFKVAL